MTTFRGSLYCWIVLAIFIFITVAFMINFYNRAVAEIDATVVTTNVKAIRLLNSE